MYEQQTTNAHNWLTEQEHRRLTDVGESELVKKDRPLKIYKMATWSDQGSLKVIWNATIIRLYVIINSLITSD